MKIKLTRAGQVFDTATRPAYIVTRDGVKIGTATKSPSGYSMGAFTGSRKRLLTYAAQR